MNTEFIVGWTMTIVFCTVGISLLFVKVDAEKLREVAHSNPMLSLYRFPACRYGASAICFIMALVSYSAVI